MKMRWLVLGLAAMCGAAALSSPVWAAKKNSFELYSWPQEGTVNYCYAILPASKDPKTVDAVKAAKDQVCGGSGDLKRIMGQAIPFESKVTWKVDEANGFVLPPRDIVNDLTRFAVTIPYKLVVEEPSEKK